MTRPRPVPGKTIRNWVMCRFCGWLMEPCRDDGWVCVWCFATAQYDGPYVWWRR